MFRKKSSRIYVKENSSNIAEVQTVRISPNPAQNVVKVEFSGDGTIEMNALFKLSNTKGQFVLEEKLNNNPSTVNLSEISTGIYIYSIYSDGKEIQTGKLIINK